MSRQIIRLPQSIRDVDEAAIFLAEDNPTIAFRFLEAVEQSLRDLARMPEMGVARQYQRPYLEGVRMFRVRSFEKFLIFYRPTQQGVEIVRILHASRDIDTLLESSD